MQPKINLLPPELVTRIFDESYQILDQVGVKVQHEEALDLLDAAWCVVDRETQIVRIPAHVVQAALETVPKRFYLYNAFGKPAVCYGDDSVHFDPGSAGVNILDPDTLEHRPATSQDLIKVIHLTEMLPQYDAQSTALVCSDVPKEIGDIYRLYLVLMHSVKPVVTGAFSARNIQAMFDLLALTTGGRDELALKPRAIFDVCPTPPMIWSHFACQNLIDLAKARIPAELVSMPLAGAGAPVTLLGSIVQHTVESLSGIVIHQRANPGAPIVWGGAPAIFDMRQGTTPMGAVETAMIDAGYARVGKELGLPTHAYLGATDAKVVDAQAGLESGLTALIGALAGINMISGAGMLDFLACVSPEKLVIDAEAVGMVKRMLAGIQLQTSTLALELFENFAFKADFLKQKATKQLFKNEQYLPSKVIDRGTLRSWQESGKNDTFQRAKEQVKELLSRYKRPEITEEMAREMRGFMERYAGMEGKW